MKMIIWKTTDVFLCQTYLATSFHLLVGYAKKNRHSSIFPSEVMGLLNLTAPWQRASRSISKLIDKYLVASRRFLGHFECTDVFQNFNLQVDSTVVCPVAKWWTKMNSGATFERTFRDTGKGSRESFQPSQFRRCRRTPSLRSHRNAAFTNQDRRNLRGSSGTTSEVSSPSP